MVGRVRRPVLPSLPTVRREVRDLLVVAGPLILAQLAQMSMSFVDTLMAGRLGQDALAGIALGGTVFQLTSIVCMGVLFSVAPLVSQAHGAGDAAGAARAGRQGLWLAALLALPGFLLFRGAEPLLLAAGQEPGAATLAAGYLGAAAFGFLPSLLLTALRGFLEGLSDTRPIMVVLLVGVVLNVLANNALMFGRWGFPALGLVGTGVATALVYAVMAVAAGAYVALRHRRYRVLRGLRRPDGATLRELLRVGWPIGLTLGFEGGLFGATALLMGLFGQAALAGHQIAIQAASVTFMIPVGLSIATGVRVGQAVGRGDDPAVRRAGLTGIASAVAVMTVTATLFRFAPGLVVAAFLDAGDPANAEAVRHAVTFLGIAALFQVVDGIQVASAGALRGLRDTRAPMVISLVAYWAIGMTVATTLAFPLGLEGRGLWIGLVVGLGVAAVLLLRRFLRRSAARPGTPRVRALEPREVHS
jgi:MATE family multidrug resistance protein